VTINSLPFTVIGITPPGFHGPQWSDAMGAFVPASMLPAIAPGSRGVLGNRGQPAFRVMGRVRPGVSLEQARSALDVELQRLIVAYPQFHIPARVELLPEWRSRPVPKAARFTVVIVGAFPMGALLILAVAIANAANLLFARTADRDREGGNAAMISMQAGHFRAVGDC
jgi:hypothetical protein